MRLRSVRVLAVPFLALSPLLALNSPASAQTGTCAPGGGTAGYPLTGCALVLGSGQVRVGSSVNATGTGARPRAR